MKDMWQRSMLKLGTGKGMLLFGLYIWLVTRYERVDVSKTQRRNVIIQALHDLDAEVRGPSHTSPRLLLHYPFLLLLHAPAVLVLGLLYVVIILQRPAHNVTRRLREQQQ